MDITTVIACVFIVIGAVIMALSIYKFRTMLKIFDISFVTREHLTIKRSFVYHMLLMCFFFVGYIIVLLAYVKQVHIVSELFVGVIFFFGACFVLLTILMQRRMLLSIKSEYLQIKAMSHRLKEEQKNLTKSNELLKQEISEHKRDVEEKSRLEQKLHESKKMEAIGKLAGGIAHDFNNMLSGITGFAEIIKWKYAEENPKLKKYVDTILDTSKRAADLVAQLLAFARKGKYQIVVVNMHETINNVLQIIEHTFDRRIEIVKNLQANYCSVMGDRNQLQNVVLNIAVNARDAMPHGGTLAIHSRVIEITKEYISQHNHEEVKPGSHFLLEITDTGVGMNEETKTRAFEPFFTTKEMGDGAGLGLSSVYGTIKNHGGAIEMYSEFDKGTTFKIFLPIAQKVKSDTQKYKIDVSKCTGNILIIDDEQVVKEMFLEMLKELHFSVTACENGREGVEYYRKNFEDIDLVMLDIIMPKLGGYDCFKQLRKINPKVKTVLVSGHSMNEDARKMMNEGAFAFLQKPFNMKKLSKIVNEALSN